MHFGIEGQHPGHGRWNVAASRAGGEDGATRGERTVARLDQDGDGKLSLSELEGSRLGRKLTVDRFARLDADDDGMLGADEIDNGRGRHGRASGHGGAVAENVVLAQLADYLTERVAPEINPLTTEVLARLDGDESGAVNSEEIAGTRLAELIGAGFYDLDADRSGALDAAELNGFIEAEILGLAEPAAAPDDAPEAPAPEAGLAPVEGGADVAAPVTEPMPDVTEEPVAVADPVPETEPGAETTLASLEAALALLRDDPAQSQTYEAVRGFYEDVRTILGAA